MRTITKIGILLFILLIQPVFISVVFAQASEITNGLNYLTSVQNPDGSWEETGVDINNSYYSTSTIVETLRNRHKNSSAL